MNQPDPKLHQRISFVKSAVRIVAGVSLMFGSIVSAGVLLIVAELIGVLEELV